MGKNSKMIAEIAAQLGLSGGARANDDMISKFEGKSEAELEREILALREKLKESDVSYEKQIAILQSLLPMMKGEQRQRLERIIRLMRS